MWRPKLCCDFRAVEIHAPAVVQVFKHVLEERCGRFRPNATGTANAAGAAQDAGQQHQVPPGLPPLVVDVGANFGFFTAYAAVMGCRRVC